MILPCPTCDARLEVQDGFVGETQCPTCLTVFSLAPAAPQPVVQPPVAALVPPPPPRPARRDPDDYDRPRRRRRRYANDAADYDPPRPPRVYELDDPPDPPDDRPASDSKARFAAARTGALLLAISLWLYLGVMAMLTLVLLIGWAGGEVPEALVVLTGVVGLGNWIVGGVGIGFGIAGPRRARGLAIAAMSVAGAHLLLTLIGFGQWSSGPGEWRGGFSTLAWLVMATSLPFLDGALPALVLDSRSFGWLVVAALAGGCELARLILILLTFRAQAEVGGAYKAVTTARLAVVVVAYICGAAVVVAFLVAVVIQAAKMHTSRSGLNLAGFAGFLILLGHALMLILPATTAHAVRDGLARRAR